MAALPQPPRGAPRKLPWQKDFAAQSVPVVCEPDLNPARELFDNGMFLVSLHRYSKQPYGEDWNHRFVTAIDPKATGYGLPLAKNGLCSLDPDNYQYAVIGMRALGFDLDEFLNTGVRTLSTRPGSGGRSTFQADGEICWLKFSSKETGTILELRASSENLQDTIPGVVYSDKDGNLCQQKYANGKRLLDCPPLPDSLFDWWERCSTDIDFYRDQQAVFLDAVRSAMNIERMDAHIAISTGRGGSVLAFPAPGLRGPFNADNTVDSILDRHGYKRDPLCGRYSPPSASGAPGVRPIPGRDGLWRSDHASDPLHGTFDAWTAFVVLDHAGNFEAAKQAARERYPAKQSTAEQPPEIDIPEDSDELLAAEEYARNGLPLDTELLNPPGVLGEITQYILSTAQRAQPVLAVTAALSAAGTIVGRKYATETGLRSNLYLVGVAGTSVGKEHGRNVVKYLMASANLSDFVGGEDIGSGQGLITRVSHTPNVLFQLDEFGLFMQEVQNPNNGSHKASILTNFMKMFSSAGTTYRGAEYADQRSRPRQDIEYPCVHLHATTTPETLFDALGSAHVTSGYLNRVLVTFAPDGRPKRSKVRMTAPPQSILDWAAKAREAHSGLLGLNPATPIVVAMDEDADWMFGLFDDEIEGRLKAGDRTGTAPLWGRAWEHAAKIALVCACATNIDSPVINKTCASWAIKFVRHWVANIEIEVSRRVADSDFMKVVNAAADVLRKCGREGYTERELVQYCRPFRALKPTERDQVVTALLRDGDAKKTPIKKPSNKGKPRIALIHRDYWAALGIED